MIRCSTTIYFHIPHRPIQPLRSSRLTSMSDQSTMSGACYCRKICYDLSQVDSQTLDGVVCHCTVSWEQNSITSYRRVRRRTLGNPQTCQKLHTMVSYNVALKREQLKLAKGEPKVGRLDHCISILCLLARVTVRCTRILVPTTVNASCDISAEIVVRDYTRTRTRCPKQFSSKLGPSMSSTESFLESK